MRVLQRWLGFGGQSYCNCRAPTALQVFYSDIPEGTAFDISNRPQKDMGKYLSLYAKALL